MESTRVKIPWKDNKVELKNNYSNSVNCSQKLLQLERLLEATATYIFGRYIEKGYAGKVEKLKEDPKMWHMPHFPVIRNNKTVNCI